MPQYRRPPKRKPASTSGIQLIILLLASIILFSLFDILGGFGLIIRNIIFGLLGLSAYAFTIITIIFSLRNLINNRLTIDKKLAMRYLPLFIIGIIAVHTITTQSYINNNYVDYLAQCYTNGDSNGGGIFFGLISYPISNIAGYYFALSILVIIFFSVAFISLYPLFLNSDNFKTKNVRYVKSRKDIVYRDELLPNNIEVGNQLFVGTPDGRSDNNKIHRKSAFASSKTREFDIMFPNKQDIDSESLEDNKLIDMIKNKGSYDILFTNPYDNQESNNATVKPKREVIIDNEPAALLFPTVSNSENTHRATTPISKPKPIIAANDKYANYTLGYRQAQIKKSIDDGVEITSHSTSKRLGIFDEAASNEKYKAPTRAEKAKSKEEAERFEKAKNRLYGKEILEDKEPDNTFESLFNNKSTEQPRKVSIFDKEQEEPKKSSYDILYGNKTDSYNLPEYNLDKNLFNKTNNNKLEIEPIIEDKSIQNEEVWTEYDFKQDSSNSLSDKHILTELPENAPIRALRSDIGKSHNSIPKKPIERTIMDTKIDAKQVSIVDSPTAVIKKTRYISPPEELLRMYPRVESDSIDEHQDRCIALRNVLMEYGIDTVVDRYTVGPSFTRYEITMPIGVTVKRIQQNADNISMRLKANKIRIEAPIPGKNAVGVEVANAAPSTVGLRECIRSASFKKESELTFLLGMNISGEVYTCNIVKMPHLLIAGATGSGKSVCINSLICSLLYKYSPDHVRLILIDPKRVELSHYNNLPHLLIPEIIFDAEKAMNAMNWATKEMERRYELFHNMRVRNLEEHNKKSENEGLPFLPYIVIVIDELADLMTYKKRDIEEKIKRLAQLARAAGIHLIFATQRPSVDIITGTIKANFPSRIAFAVTSFADSKTILDHGGADKLRGQGDMLYAPSGAPDPIRLQGAFITNDEVEAITDFVKANNKSYYDESIEAEINAVKASKNEEGIDADDNSSEDDVFIPALKLIVESNQASISMIQRRFAVGYARAARLVDEMEQRGYIGAADGSKPRDVKITMSEFNAIFGGDNN